MSTTRATQPTFPGILVELFEEGSVENNCSFDNQLNENNSYGTYSINITETYHYTYSCCYCELLFSITQKLYVSVLFLL